MLISKYYNPWQPSMFHVKYVICSNLYDLSNLYWSIHKNSQIQTTRNSVHIVYTRMIEIEREFAL